MTLPNSSSFYDHLIDAKKFNLCFPLDQDDCGPYWTQTGELILRMGDMPWEEEEIEAVSLGSNRYRLAERCLGPFTSLRLYWGDEFLADRAQENTLNLTRVVVPRLFEHYRFLTSKGFSNANPIAELVHEVGGGWETVAVGMLTLTVPVFRAQEFQLKMNAAGLLPGVLRMED